MIYRFPLLQCSPLTVSIDPSNSWIRAKSDLDQWSERDLSVNTDYGQPFKLTVQYHAADFGFGFTWNDGSEITFDIPFGTADINFVKVEVKGTVDLVFIGFTEPRETQLGNFVCKFGYLSFHFADSITAIPVDTIIKYQCPEDHVFHHDWYVLPVVLVTCLNDGTFHHSANWSQCHYRELILETSCTDFNILFDP